MKKQSVKKTAGAKKTASFKRTEDVKKGAPAVKKFLNRKFFLRPVVLMSLALILVLLFSLPFFFFRPIIDGNSNNCDAKVKEKYMDTQVKVLPSGLKYQMLKAATTPSQRPKKGQTVIVHYTGWLDENGKPGKKFDSSLDRGQKFSFAIGLGRVIKGWDEGVLDMQVGESRRLIIPANLAYGEAGIRGVIPGNATLIFDVELFEVK